MDENAEEEPVEKEILFAEFLERIPPGTATAISDLFDPNGRFATHLKQPDIQLHCDSDACKGVRFFACHSNAIAATTEGRNVFLRYECRNCRQSNKLFALIVVQHKEAYYEGTACKIGEFPTFGPPIPARVISLIGPDRELFIKGRRAENQGLGVGAFAYYRQVVENQKGRLIREIGKVAKRLGASTEDLNRFETAANETQFSKAIDDIKSAIPQSLLIDGHNPLILLHSALSEGLHQGTDEHCLELATSIRLVLTELSERMGQALKDEAELKQAVGRLTQTKKTNAGM